jgi:hypothetical protein
LLQFEVSGDKVLRKDHPGTRTAWMNAHGLIMRKRVEMIGKLARKYIFFGISAIGVSAGIAEVDIGFPALTLSMVFVCPCGAETVLEALCPRAHALSYSLPSLREGCGDPDVRAIPGPQVRGTWGTRHFERRAE